MTGVGVVLPAAGRGERAGGAVPKQFREIAGVPMLLRTLRPFSSHPQVTTIVVTLPSGSVSSPPQWLATLQGDRLRLVAGGATRAESVRAGLAILDHTCDIVLVHDAARPFVTRDTIDAVIAVARAGEGAVPCVPVSDTLKRADVSTGRVIETVDRDRLWRAQTPQGFPLTMLRMAFDAAAGREAQFTDDASMVEANGGIVRIIPDDPLNVKVTTPHDFLVAEALAHR